MTKAPVPDMSQEEATLLVFTRTLLFCGFAPGPKTKAAMDKFMLTYKPIDRANVIYKFRR